MSDPTIRLREIVEAATPGDLATAEKRETHDHYECPLCETEGYVDGETFTNYDQRAVGVQFFGIGDTYQHNERAYWAGIRLARAVADPAFVEKVARTICRPIWRTALPLITEEALDQYVEMNWREYIDAAEASISLLAAHALGE